MAKKIVLGEKTKVSVITTGIVLVALILCYAIYRPHASKVKELYLSVEEEKQRLVARKDLARLDDIIREYRKYFFKGTNINILRDTISALARDTDVDIVSMQPPQVERFNNYAKISFKVRLKCSYNRLGKFIETIERLSTLTKIEEIRIGEGEDYKLTAANDALPEKEAKRALSLTIAAYCVE